MDFKKVIESRYSVRKYEKKTVEKDKLERVLNAGRIAPSARNFQNWKFVVVTNPEMISAIAESCEQKWMSSAPIIIAIVCTEPRIMSCEIPAGPVDCSIAIDHMTLWAVEEGLGTCWIGKFNQGESKKLLDIPQEMEVIELLTLGYPADKPKAEKPRKALEEVVCWEKFN